MKVLLKVHQLAPSRLVDKLSESTVPLCLSITQILLLFSFDGHIGMLTHILQIMLSDYVNS